MTTPLPAIECKRKVVFGETMYYAICNKCKKWVKSPANTYVWTSRASRNRAVLYHKQLHAKPRKKGARMKMIVHNLPELMNENQQLLGHITLIAMHANGFKVDGVKIEFAEEQQ